MIWEVHIVLLVLIIASALMALSMKDLLSSSITMGIFGFLMCILWAEMQAVDVSFTEAAIGAGISTVLLIATVYKTTRRSSD